MCCRLVQGQRGGSLGILCRALLFDALLITGPTSQRISKSQHDLLALLSRVLSEPKENSIYRQGWPCRIRGDTPKELAA